MKQNSQFDAKAYLAHLNVPYELSITPSLELLRELTYRQVLAVPYQNTSLLFMTTPLDISIEGLQDRLVRQRLGGNCYENSELLYYALTFFGFETYRIPAWATNGARYNRTIPSAHNITLVRFNGDLYLLDSAFSYNSLRFPVKLGFDKTEEQTIMPGDEYQLIYAEDHYQFNMKIKNEWFSLYCFQRQPDQDFPVTIDEKGTLQNYTTLLQQKDMIPIRDRFIKISQVTPDGRLGFQYDFSTNLFILIEFKNGVKLTDGPTSYSYQEFFDIIQRRCNLVLQPALCKRKYEHITRSEGGAKLEFNIEQKLSQDVE